MERSLTRSLNRLRHLNLHMGKIFLMLYWLMGAATNASVNVSATPSPIAPSHSQSEVGQVAIHFLEKLVQGKVELPLDTAISDHCPESRRKKIKEQLKFFAETQLDPDDSFHLEAVKRLGNLAAVLLKTQNARTPLRIRVLGITLIKREGKWMVTPIPGRFTNTGYGYDPAIEKNVTTLENWLERQIVIREAKARISAETNLIKAIKKEETRAKFDAFTPKQAVSHFIQKCHEKNLLAILACLGAGSGGLESDLATTAKNISEGLGSTAPENAWQLVSSPDVLVYSFNVNSRTQEIPVGFWNPLTQDHIHILYFSIHRSHGKTWLSLPLNLTISSLPRREQHQLLWQHHHADEETLKHQFVKTLFKKIPQRHFSDTAFPLSEAFLLALDKRDFTQAFLLLPNQGDYFGKNKNQQNLISDLSDLWKTLYHLRKSPRHDLPLISENSLALLPLQYAKNNHLSNFQTVKIWFFKDDNGWHLIPENTISELNDTSLNQQKKKLIASMHASVKKRQDAFSKSLLRQVTTLTPPLKLPAPDNSTARTLFTNFRSYLRSKNTTSALAQCAILKGTSNTQTLKTFSYALKGALDQTGNDHILNIAHSGPWTGISLKTYSQTAKSEDFPLYLLVNTPKGTKILLDIDLRYATNKGRKLINQRNWKKLETNLPEQSLTHIKSLFAKHEEVCKKHLNLKKTPKP